MPFSIQPGWRCLVLVWVVVVAGAPLSAAELKIVLPLGRTAYQTNEWIDVSVVRSSPTLLAGSTLKLTAAARDGARIEAEFPVAAVPVWGGDALRTEHYHLNGWLLRPGRYTLEVAADGAAARTEIDVYSHVRRSNFRLINWGRATGANQLVEGEDSLGFNLFYGHYSQDNDANFIRAGVDFMSNCTMGGAHQMDIRSECDWSDPYVTRGGTRRVVRRAFVDRTRPNVQGIHFYDEPGLTWLKHPITGETTPHGIPAQVRAFKNAFGVDPIAYYDVKPEDPARVQRWRDWALWKLSFMNAAWKESQFGVSYVRPDYLSITQSQYGWSAFTDGYYFNVARSLPVASGHGGYDDYGAGYFNPSYTLEMARARDLTKPCWYLPTWYGNIPSDRFRLEQYLSFMTNVQGMITPPDVDPFEPATKPAAEGVVESNNLMARLGTIFTTLPVTRPPVAVLYSMTQNLHVQVRDMNANYAHANAHGQNLPLVYLAGKSLQHQFLTLVEEDILDGTLAANHRAVILTGIDELPPNVTTALEQFATAGGLILMTSDCTVKIAGAIALGVTPALPDADVVNRLMAAKKYSELGLYTTVGKQFQGAAGLAAALKTHFHKAGIEPVFDCDNPGIAASRQAAGDIEYLFAVNATYDAAAGGTNAIRAATATISIRNGGRPVYDAVRGGPVGEFQDHGDKLSGEFRFGPGQMRVIACTTRPIGGVQVLTPVLKRDYTQDQEPVRLEFAATLVDHKGRVLAGSAPLELWVTDPLGQTRQHLFRATEMGTCRVSLPLAANDPPGRWRIVAQDLLAGTRDTVEFNYAPAARCGAVAGATRRAVSFGNDRDNLFRFFRVHHDVTLVVGSSDFHAAAARRIADALEPWGVRCKVAKAADVNRPRPLSDAEAPTWVGLEPSRARTGQDNPVAVAGFDISGPVVLLGNPQDNPLIKYVQESRFLPYACDPKLFPGRGRGMFAWQRDAIGPGQDSIALIAWDEAGLNEAIGSMYEAVAGLDPLTPFDLPAATSITPARTADVYPQPVIAWQVTLPDRAVSLKIDGRRLIVVTQDQSSHAIDAGGNVGAPVPLTAEQVATAVREAAGVTYELVALRMAKDAAPADRIVKKVVTGPGRMAVAHWGGGLQIFAGGQSPKVALQLPQDIAALTWFGDQLVAALADGRILALHVK